ncbi:hypothetical protein B0T14DRAFT_496723 [Immersiella caudata]|uniref:Transmembrane protein n=1 Tax=Immersiella caudata TaxID=314043 RepID=A0AA39WRH4_9PEZI|nr:hypothetical protein B0T14DRAFT_496723 [Immersiella caudata]
MAKRRRLSLLSLLCAALASSHQVMGQTTLGIGAAVRSAAQHRVGGLSVQLIGNLTPATTPTGLTPASPMPDMETRSFHGPPCEITAAPVLENFRRQVNDKVVTIVFLSSALSSANSHAAAMSQSLTSSISQLQASASSLSSSASSAILSVQASASRALDAAESSASDAVFLAEESASSRISEILALASISAMPTPPPANATTYRAQALASPQSNSVSVAIVAIAIVASIVGSTLLSILGFWIFVKRRGAKKKQEEQQLEQQKCQDEEVHVSAALDRAIVSYIAKESPPTSPDSQGLGPSPTIEGVLSNEPLPMFFAPPPRSVHRPLPPPHLSASLAPSKSPSHGPIYRTHTRSHSTGSILTSPPRGSQPPSRHIRTHSAPKSPPRISLQTAGNAIPRPSPPGPPPTGPLPQLPSTTYVHRKPSRKKVIEDEEQTYGAIITRPLTNTSAPSPVCDKAPMPPTAEGEYDTASRSERRDPNWPLTGTQLNGPQWL